MDAIKHRFSFLTRSRIQWVVLAFLLVAPFLSSSPYVIFMATAMVFYSMVVLALNVINNAGIWNLAHATFLALGGYITGYLAIHYHLNVWITIPIGAVVAGLISVVLMVPILRLHQHYMMIATFNLSLIGSIILTNWEEVTSGTSGLSGIPAMQIPWLVNEGGQWSLALVSAIRPEQTYYIVLFGAILTYVIVRRIEESPLGLVMRAMRDDDQATQSMGQDTRRLRLLAMGIGSTIAGFAGGIYAMRFLSVSPQTSSLDNSVLFMVMLIVGGSGNMYGAIAGASLLALLPELLRGSDRYRLLVYGVILLAMMLFRPQGLIPERVRRIKLPEGLKFGKELGQKKIEGADGKEVNH
jgi:branched-chain amino acid transport system permease protein